MSKLVIFRGDAVETEQHLGREPVRIGRDERNTIVLNDKSISRFHAEVRAEGGTFYIVDLKSRNGVYVNGHQIKGRAALSLGVPVTLGAYELALEDDLSTADEVTAGGRTVVNPASAQRGERPSRSATQRMAAQGAAATPSSNLFKQPALFWSVLGVATLLVCVLTYALVRYITRRPQPPPEPPVAAATTTIEVPPPPPVDPNKEAIDQHLNAARDAIQRRDFDAVLTEVAALLELDPTNQEAVDLKRQADEGKAAAAKPTTAPVKPPPMPAVVEVSGIPKQTSESQAEYDARVLRIKTNYQEGLRNVQRQDFVAALANFAVVKREQPGYEQIDTIIGETQQKQHKAADDAVAEGQKSEQDSKLADAKRWYERARTIDPNSASARERLAALSERTTKAGLDAFTNGEVRRKRGDNARALEFYKQAVDLLPNGPERTQAQQWLEKLKP